MKLQFPVSEEIFKWSAASADQFVYEWLAASPELWQLATQTILTLIKEAVDVTFNGTSPANTTVLK